MSITIRPAVAADGPGVAAVHVRTWRTTYQGIVPDEFLANLSEEKRTASWCKHLAALPAGEHLNVALDGAQIIGFCNAGKNRTPELAFDGEILAIYLFKEYEGQGIGRRLFGASQVQLARAGFKTAMLWVLADNPTCRFYDRMGGRVVAEKVESIGGKALKELAYAWDNLA